MKKICLTVTTDLTYDQRMIRICTALAEAGYEVMLVGRRKRDSLPLVNRPYRQKRLGALSETGKLLYISYNIRLLFFLLTHKADVFCAIDLDTILPVWLISTLKKKRRVYDAHELFCEMKEIVTRPGIYKAWKKLEKICIPKFKWGYTVNQPIADEFKKMYGVKYGVIRNVPFLKQFDENTAKERFIIYQGSVNEGRSFETLIPAMQWIDIPLIICGAGNFMEQVKTLIKTHNVADKVILKGLVTPDELLPLTRKALIGITLFENNGKSNYLSLANRFFDYIQAGTPQLCVDYPAYREINNLKQIAVTINDLSPENIAQQINNLIADETLYKQLRSNCLELRQQINWDKEKEALLLFYKTLFETVG